MQRTAIIPFLTYGLLRAFLYPFSLLSYPSLHRVGMTIGSWLFFLLPRYRKRILSNLALASDLSLSNTEYKPLAKKTLGNLVITCLEYGKLSKEKHIDHLVSCQNPEVATSLLSQGKGLIFLCGHQANWELFFLEGTKRMPGVAIGQPVQNHFLYRWILRIRQKFGGRILHPNEAVKEGLRALKQGKFLGIVGDQGMPQAGFSSPFLGRNAWTSPLPALLSYRSGAPIITATMTRQEGRYLITYSEPLFPNQQEPMHSEVPRLMQKALSYLEDSIKTRPSEWLWSHNRWKQQTRGNKRKVYCQDSLAIILPCDKEKHEALLRELATIRQIYPQEGISLFTPLPLPSSLSWDGEVIPYSSEEELLQTIDYRFKLVFNFTDNKKISSHFYRLAAQKVVDLPTLYQEANLPPTAPLSQALQGAIFYAR